MSDEMVQSTEETVIEPVAETPREKVLRLMTQGLNMRGVDIYDDIESEDWKVDDEPTMILFRDSLEAYFGAASMLKEKFDATVWAGHSDGTVPESITSIRKEREGDAPGRKAKVLTPAEKLAKRLGK